MPRLEGTYKFGSNLEPKLNAPLDAREVVAEKADLTAVGSFPYFYLGMTVFVTEELKKYTLIGNDPTVITNWKVDEASSGGGDSTLQEGIEAQVAVGGIPVGKTYAAGDDLEAILRDMLYPLAYPTFSEPSVSLSTNASRVLETGATATVTLTATANQGKIEPAYKTSGKRAGAVTEYALVGVTGSENTTGVWNDVTVDGTNRSFTAQATFGVGEQPKDSHGNDYDSPYPGGTKTSSALTFEFVNCVWSNESDIATIAKHAAKSSSVKEYSFTFPPQTNANPECFLIPASWTVSKVEVLNELSGKYEDCASEFTVTDDTRQDAGGNDIAYKKYTDNRGYAADVRTIKVTIA